MIYPYVYFVILLGATIKVIKFTKFTGAPAAVGQVVSSLVQPNKAVTIQNNITNRAPAPLLPGGLFQVTKPAPATATNGQDLFLKDFSDLIFSCNIECCYCFKCGQFID